MVPQVFYNSAIYNPGNDFVVMGQVRQSFENGMDLRKRFPSGIPVPEYIAALKNTPQFNVTSTDLRTLLEIFDGTSWVYCAGETWVGYVKSACPDRSGLSYNYHVQAIVYDSVWVLNRVEARQGQVATADFSIVPIYDGTHPPVLWNAPTDLTLLTLRNAPDFTLGYGYVQGSPYYSLQSFTLETNAELDRFAGDGEVWDSAVHLKQQAPVVTIDLLDLQHVSDWDVVGNEILSDLPIWAAYKQILKSMEMDPSPPGNNSVAFGDRSLWSAEKAIAFKLEQAKIFAKSVQTNGPNDAAILTIEIDPYATDSAPPVQVYVDQQVSAAF